MNTHNNNSLISTPKILMIGSITSFSEMFLGGHYLESIKLSKQSSGSSYNNIITDLWKKDGIKCFHRGFYPWGLIQSTKGIPLLYTQHNVSNLLEKYNISPSQNSIISGLVGGAVQGIYVTPLQRLKVLAITSDKKLSYNTTYFMKDIIKNHGIKSLFDGLTPTITRRSLDWGIRLYGIDYIANNYYNKKRKELNSSELIVSSIIGGSFSAVTTPIDVMITQLQKNNNKNEKTKLDILQEFYHTNGPKGFTRGIVFRTIHTSWNTAFLYGLSGFLHDKLLN